MTTAYCTISDVKAPGRLNIESSDYDDEIDDLIAAASEQIDREFDLPEGSFSVATDTTRYFLEENLHVAPGIYSRRLMLDMPLLSLTTLVDAGGQTYTADKYRLWPYNYPRKRGIELLSSYAWTWQQDGRIAVTGKFGYSVAVPPGIQEATAMYAAWMFKRWQAALQDATANAELGQIIYGSAMPKQIVAMLSRYKDGTKLL